MPRLTKMRPRYPLSVSRVPHKTFAAMLVLVFVLWANFLLASKKSLTSLAAPQKFEIPYQLLFLFFFPYLPTFIQFEG
jgi:hypothetical protein